MSILRTAIFLWLLCAMRLQVSAGEPAFARQLEIKALLESRINGYLRIYDERLASIVDIEWRKFEAPLPGTDNARGEILVTNARGEFSPSSVQSVRVTVLNSSTELPASIKEVIQTALGLGKGVPVEVRSQTLPEDLRVALAAKVERDGQKSEMERAVSAGIAQLGRNVSQLVQGLTQGIFLKVVVFLMVVLAGSGILGVLLSARHQRFSRKLLLEDIVPPMKAAFEGLIPSLASGRAAASQEVSRQREIRDRHVEESRDSNGKTAAVDEIRALPRASLQSLLSDCYWCGQDEYAAFLWTSMSPTQRHEAQEANILPSVYFQFLQSVGARDLGLHGDPAYVNPLPTERLSQQDLGAWVTSEPSGLVLLSQMRKSQLEVSIEVKLASSRASVERERLLHSLRATSPSQHRLISDPLFDSPVTEQDEDYIFSNPQGIPQQSRRQIRSLVWLALLPVDERKVILAAHAAERLAEGWIGSPQILQLLGEALSSQKKILVEDLTRRVQAHRSAPVIQQVTNQAVSRLESLGILQLTDANTQGERRKAA